MNNVYGEVVVPPNTPTVVNGITVPERAGYSFKGLIVWCHADVEITVMFNLQKIGGGRVSGAVQTLFLDYSASPFGMNPFDTVTILAIQDSSLTPPGSYTVYSTLLFEQL
jgi:hypothetical protein